MYDQAGNPSEFIVADLQLGSYFGQDALLNRAPDHLEDSVKTFCASNCQFLCIEKCQIEQLIKMHEAQEQMSRFMALKALPWLHKIPRQRMKALVISSEVRLKDRGTYVFKEGDSIDGFYVSLKGEFQVTKKIPLQKPCQSDNEIRKLHADPDVSKLYVAEQFKQDRSHSMHVQF